MKISLLYRLKYLNYKRLASCAINLPIVFLLSSDIVKDELSFYKGSNDATNSVSLALNVIGQKRRCLYFTKNNYICTSMERARIGILFVHGIAGNNRIFRFLVPQVPEGCRQEWIGLAGHGGDALDFSRASMKQWRQQVADGVGRLESCCDRVIAVAHSMGCLLVLEQAAIGRLAGMLLLNPPLRIRIKARALKNMAKVGLGFTGNDAMAHAALEAYGVSFDGNPFHYYGWPMRYFELFREARRVRKMVTRSRMDCLMAVAAGGSDELVSPKKSELFCASAGLPHGAPPGIDPLPILRSR